MQGREKKHWLHQFALYPSKGFGPEAQSKFLYRNGASRANRRVGGALGRIGEGANRPLIGGGNLVATVGLTRFGHAFGSFEIYRRLFHFAYFLIEGRALPIGQGIIRIK